MSLFDDKMTELADSIKQKNTTVAGKLSVQEMIDAVKGISTGGGDSTVKFGYWTDNGKFQEVNLSGNAPVDLGDAVDADAVLFETGKDAPQYAVGGAMLLYRCADYDDGGKIPAYNNIYVSGISPVNAQGEFVQIDKKAEGTMRVWQFGNYGIAFDQIAGYWCLYDKSTILPWAETALFRLKIEGLSDNSGTLENPTWWDTFVDSATRWKTPEFAMEQDDNSGFFKRYFYLRLKGGTAYSFGMTIPQEWYSGNLYLYNSAGSKVASSTSVTEAINGVTVNSKLTYTPTATGVYKLEVDGGMDFYSDKTTTVCYPAPETSTPPATDPWAYDKSQWEEVTGGDVEFLSMDANEVAERDATGIKKWSGYKGVLDETTNTWRFADSITNGLEVKGYAPRVGEVYSADTVIWIQDLKSASDSAGKMVCLVHGDTAPVEDGKTASFIDDTETCVVKLLNQTVVKSEHPKFGSRCWFTNYTGSATDEIQLVGLPEMEAFTAEWWQYSSMNSGVWGGAALSVIDNSSYTTTTITTPELSATNPNRKTKRWFHHAFVREAGSSYVFEYVDGVPIYRHTFAPKLGGASTVAIKTGGGNSTNTQNYGDELAIFNYTKYNGGFRPPAAPYDTIISGLGKGNNPKRAVTVSGIKVMHFANDPSYQLVNASATGTSRQWLTADGKWYVYWDFDRMYCWVVANGTSGNSDSWICAAILNDRENDQSMNDFNPIGHPGWVDYNDQTVPVSVLAN